MQLDSMRSKLQEVGGDDVEVGGKIDKAEVRCPVAGLFVVWAVTT